MDLRKNEMISQLGGWVRQSDMLLPENIQLFLKLMLRHTFLSQNLRVYGYADLPLGYSAAETPVFGAMMIQTAADYKVKKVGCLHVSVYNGLTALSDFKVRSYPEFWKMTILNNILGATCLLKPTGSSFYTQLDTLALLTSIFGTNSFTRESNVSFDSLRNSGLTGNQIVIIKTSKTRNAAGETIDRVPSGVDHFMLGLEKQGNEVAVFDPWRIHSTAPGGTWINTPQRVDAFPTGQQFTFSSIRRGEISSITVLRPTGRLNCWTPASNSLFAHIIADGITSSIINATSVLYDEIVTQIMTLGGGGNWFSEVIEFFTWLTNKISGESFKDDGNLLRSMRNVDQLFRPYNS